MDKKMLRREFLMTAPAAAGMLAAAQASTNQTNRATLLPSKLGGTSYVPKPDYPRQPKRIPEVRLKDRFWAPKIRSTPRSPSPLRSASPAERDGPSATTSWKRRFTRCRPSRIPGCRPRWKRASGTSLQRSGRSRPRAIPCSRWPRPTIHPRGKPICWTWRGNQPT